MNAREAIRKAKEAPPKPVPPPPLSKERAAELAKVATYLGRTKSLRKLVRWPGGDVELELRVLSAIELDEALAASSYAVASLFGDGDGVQVRELSDASERRKLVEVVWRALFDPATGERVFPTADELGRTATEDEIVALAAEYSEHKRAVDPDFESMTEQEVGVVTELIKKKDAEQLRLIASGMQKSSLLILVDQLVNSLTENSTDTP